MDFPELYIKVHNFQKNDVKFILDIVKDKLLWTKEEKILDVGCGPGDTTTCLLTQYLPPDCNIIGCDKSEAMIEYAKKNYGTHKYQFNVLDIEDTNNAWINLNKESFDKIFSFHCLHWVKNQNQATRNMYDLLKKNGILITLTPLSHPYFYLLKQLPLSDKWKSLLKPVQTWDVYYNYSDNDKKNEYIHILEENNFEIINCELLEGQYLFSSVDSFIVFDALNPFKKNLSEDKYEDFLKDCKENILCRGLVKKTMNEEIDVKYTNMLAIVKRVK